MMKQAHVMKHEHANYIRNVHTQDTYTLGIGSIIITNFWLCNNANATTNGFMSHWHVYHMKL